MPEVGVASAALIATAARGGDFASAAHFASIAAAFVAMQEVTKMPFTAARGADVFASATGISGAGGFSAAGRCSAARFDAATGGRGAAAKSITSAATVPVEEAHQRNRSRGFFGSGQRSVAEEACPRLSQGHRTYGNREQRDENKRSFHKQ